MYLFVIFIILLQLYVPAHALPLPLCVPLPSLICLRPLAAPHAALANTA